MVQGKQIYREACDENKGWNSEVSPALTRDWLRWVKQLRNVKVPRSLTKDCKKVKSVRIHQFADASNLACSTVTKAVVEQGTDKVKGLLTSKSRIAKRNTSFPRLELIGGQMAANMAKNVCYALRRLPAASVVVWMDSMVALYWITNPGKSWKVFVANRVRKSAKIANELKIEWKYCPSEDNIADPGSRDSNLDKMEKDKWFDGPDWLLEESEWPNQPELKCTPKVSVEEKPLREVVAHVGKKKLHEWDCLFLRTPYWGTLRVTAWILRFVQNCQTRKKKLERKKGPLCTEEILRARDCWVRRVQKDISSALESPGWKLELDKDSDILQCVGRIQGYRPTYLEDGTYVRKLITHTHMNKPDIWE